MGKSGDDIVVSEDPDFKGQVIITEAEFQADPSKYVALANDKHQIIVKDGDGDTVLVIGSGRVRIECDNSEVEAFLDLLPDDEPGEPSYDWLR